MSKNQNKGRPKKHDDERECFSISAYFTKNEFLAIKEKAQKRQYRSLSRFMKDSLYDRLIPEKEIERTLDIQKESYRSYCGALIFEMEEMVNQSQNFLLPTETIPACQFPNIF